MLARWAFEGVAMICYDTLCYDAPNEAPKGPQETPTRPSQGPRKVQKRPLEAPGSSGQVGLLGPARLVCLVWSGFRWSERLAGLPGLVGLPGSFGSLV